MNDDQCLKRCNEILAECNHRGWDGYDAEPITVKSCEYAMSFIKELPSDVKIPELIPEPSGELGLEWSRDKKSLILSISDKQIIEFGYCDGVDNKEIHGSISYNQVIPSEIKTYLQYFKR